MIQPDRMKATWVPSDSGITLNDKQSKEEEFDFFKCLLIYFESACEQERERERERKRENESQAGSTQPNVSTEPGMELEPTNCEIMTWAKIKSWTFNWLNHPGTPKEFDFFKRVWFLNSRLLVMKPQNVEDTDFKTIQIRKKYIAYKGTQLGW